MTLPRAPRAKNLLARVDIEAREAWEDTRLSIETEGPLKLDPTWRLMILPPTFGAMVRFRVFAPEDPEESVSVFLDTQEYLACPGCPYWEVYDGREIYRTPHGPGFNARLYDLVRLALTVQAARRDANPPPSAPPGGGRRRTVTGPADVLAALPEPSVRRPFDEPTP